MTVRDDRGDVKQTTTGFRGPLMVQSLTSAKSKFLSLSRVSLKIRILQLWVRFCLKAWTKFHWLDYLGPLLPEIDKPAYRQLRARIIRSQATSLSHTLGKLNFNQQLLIDRHGIPSVQAEGIFLSTIGTNRYYKIPGSIASGNAAYFFDLFLVSRGIIVKQVIDVGSCFGETALFFCKKYADSRVLALEALPDNYEILKQNLESQFFETDRITAVNVAVSDRVGEISLTGGVGQSNTIIINELNETLNQASKSIIRVPCDTLSKLADRYEFRSVDFIKINIEGAEPLLTTDLIEIRPKAIHVETSSQNSYENNLKMISTLSKHYVVYSDAGIILDSMEEISAYMTRAWENPEFFSDGISFHRGCSFWLICNDGYKVNIN